jgi:hypothetical protein
VRPSSREYKTELVVEPCKHETITPKSYYYYINIYKIYTRENINIKVNTNNNKIK